MLHDATVPLAIGVPPTLTVLGFGILAVGGGLCIAGIVEVVRHRTTIVPHSVVSRLVTTGAYRVSRNPMYTGLTIVYLGATLLSGTRWPLVTLPWPLAVYCLVISPEEHILAARFASLYTTIRHEHVAGCNASRLHVRNQPGEGGKVVSMAHVVATGIAADGSREVLGPDVGDSEDEMFWRGSRSA